MGAIAMERPNRPGRAALTDEQRADCVARLLRGESSRALAVEYGVSRQAMQQVRERAMLVGLKRDAGMIPRSTLAIAPTVRAALDDRDAAATALAESAAALLATVRESLDAGDVRRATGAYDSATRGLATIAGWRGWIQKPTNAAELQTSDALAAVVASWLSARDSTSAVLTIDAGETTEWQDEAPGGGTGHSEVLSVE